MTKLQKQTPTLMTSADYPLNPAHTMRPIQRTLLTTALVAMAACTVANPLHRPDAGDRPQDATVGPVCTANHALRCEDINLVRCNADGTAEIKQLCSTGCNADRKLCNAKFKDTNILWRRDNGSVAVWLMDHTVQGGGLVGGFDLGVQDLAWTVRGTGDFDGDSHSDILFQHTDGRTQLWFMNNGRKAGDASGVEPGGPGWVAQNVGDFDADGRADALWRKGQKLAIAFRGTSWTEVPAPIDPGWEVQAPGDFDGDAHSDILWRHSDGRVAIWFMNGTTVVRTSSPGGQGLGASWSVQGVGDFDADSRDDILWRNDVAPYAFAIWFHGEEPADGPWGGNDRTSANPDLTWKVEAIGDFNHDKSADLLWRATNASVAIWFLSGTSFIRSIPVPTDAQNDWHINGLLRD